MHYKVNNLRKLKKEKNISDLDIYQYVNSKDIRIHLEEIKYEFEPVCAAFIIWQSERHTLNEKHEAWRILIAGTSDVAVPQRLNCAGWDSLHKMLSDYMKLENKLLSNFHVHDTNAYYRYETMISSKEDGFVSNAGYPWSSDYKTCYESAMTDIKEDPDICKFVITKHYFDSPIEECYIQAEYDREGRLMSVKDRLPANGDFSDLVNVPSLSDYELKLEVESFEGMYFDIPIPFCKSDLVYDPYGTLYGNRRPFVLMNTVPWRKKDTNYSNGNTSDLTDMLAYGYCYDYEKHFLCDCECYYLNMEHYNDELTGEERLLAAYSAFEKNEIDGYTLMLLRDLYMNEARSGSLKKDLEFLTFNPGIGRLINNTIKG